MIAMMAIPGTMTRRGRAIARGALVLAALVLLPLAAALHMPRQSAAQSTGQDSLWVGAQVGVYGVGDYSSIGACANPSSAEAMTSCAFRIGTQYVTVYTMATDGVNVYYAGESGGLSCPIADLGANCTRIMAGPWPSGSLVSSLAASGGQIWIGQLDGKIFRCPANLPWANQNSAPDACVLLDDAGGRGVTSLLLANGRLYAGLDTYKNQGILWSCDPQTANACSTLDSYGNTTAYSLAAGGGYLWAGLKNGILWRCDLNAANACQNWDAAGNWVHSVSYDGRGTLYAAVRGRSNGVIWSCPTADADRCKTIVDNVNGWSVAAGAGGVFSSVATYKDTDLRFGTTKFSNTGGQLARLLYIPAGGPVGVGGVTVKMSAGKLGNQLARRCQAGKKPKATVTVEGPHDISKTMKVGVCSLVAGGTVKTTVDLLDPGDYTVSVRAGKHSGQATFAIVPDRTRQVNVNLKRGATAG